MWIRTIAGVLLHPPKLKLSATNSTISATPGKNFVGAFGGWTLDGFNAGIFGLVLAPAMGELLLRSGHEVTAATIVYYGQLGVAIFLLGWGCAFVWGPIADRFGRLPAMSYSILVYAVFTFLAGFSQNIWQLFFFRFLASVGIGGEWAMAGTLVAESMPERLRPTFGGILHSGVYIGLLACSAVNYAVGIDLGWRWMFYLGIIPAAFVLYIRTQSTEPRRWLGVSNRCTPIPFSAFLAKVMRPPYRTRTLVNTLLLSVSLTGLWAGSQYLGAAIVNIATVQGVEQLAAQRASAIGLGLLSAFTILGCLVVPWLVERFGRRNTLALLYVFMIVGILGCFGWGYYARSVTAFLGFIPILGIGGANLAVFTIWLPEQYPTEIRATAFAFCTTISRFVAAAGTFGIGYTLARARTMGWPLALTAIPFVFGVALVYWARETRGEVLPG